MKTCSKCGEEKDLTEFYLRRGTPRAECKACSAAYNRALRAANLAEHRARSRTSHRAVTFGLTDARYDEMLAEQGGHCALCPALPPEGISLHIDHDHACCPGRRSCGRCVRALLCADCNRGLGVFRDDAALLRAAADYLDRWRSA